MDCNKLEVVPQTAVQHFISVDWFPQMILCGGGVLYLEAEKWKKF